MKVYSFFKFYDTTHGKNISVFSSYNKAKIYAENYFKKTYGETTKVSYNKKEEIFTIKTKEKSFKTDWFKILELDVN